MLSVGRRATTDEKWANREKLQKCICQIDRLNSRDLTSSKAKRSTKNSGRETARTIPPQKEFKGLVYGRLGKVGKKEKKTEVR